VAILTQTEQLNTSDQPGEDPSSNFSGGVCLLGQAEKSAARVSQPAGSPSEQYSVAELNALSRENFVRVIGPVFEHSPWIAELTRAKQPFDSAGALHRALCDTVLASDEPRKLTLIRAHPDLAGRAARAGTLTPASTREQASGGLDQLSAEEAALFERYNREYRERFGFPFVICARKNKKEAMLAGFERRLKHSPQQEIEAALAEIFKIAELRLHDLIAS
jgi:2-oxo-4-hydroxy-4-carboxy-5-ureidoimidazoline decarboxylase